VASILQFVADGGYPGQKQTLKVKKFIWLTVGSGVVESLSDYEVTVDGKVDIFTYKGDLRIQLQLLDEDADALSGPCVLHLNAHTDEHSTYRVDNGALVVSAAFGDKRQTVSISPYNNGSMTECNLSGYIDVSAYLEPQ
jgi:hypothetical protein